MLTAELALGGRQGNGARVSRAGASASQLPGCHPPNPAGARARAHPPPPRPPSPVRQAPRVPGRHDAATSHPRDLPHSPALNTRSCCSDAAAGGAGGAAEGRRGRRPGRRAARGARRPSARVPSPGQVCHGQSALREKARGAVVAQPCVRPRAMSLSAAKRLMPGPKGFGARLRGARGRVPGAAQAQRRTCALPRPPRAPAPHASAATHRGRGRWGDGPEGLLCRSTGHRQSPSRPCNHGRDVGPVTCSGRPCRRHWGTPARDARSPSQPRAVLRVPGH